MLSDGDFQNIPLHEAMSRYLFSAQKTPSSVKNSTHTQTSAFNNNYEHIKCNTATLQVEEHYARGTFTLVAPTDPICSTKHNDTTEE